MNDNDHSRTGRADYIAHFGHAAHTDRGSGSAGQENRDCKNGWVKPLLRALPAVVTVLGLTVLRAHAAGTLTDIVQTLFGENTQTVDIILLLTILSLLPSVLIMLTGFTRIIIVMSFLRNAIGMQQTPPNQVLIGLSLILTFFVMSPVLTEVYDTAYLPYTQEEITQGEFMETAMVPIRRFMFKETYNEDLSFFIRLSGEEIDSPEETPNHVLIPSFLISEIKRAFTIGFFIYIPFIVIDMVVSSTLMAMGMMMLPPAMISLPFKVLLFVLVDGWQLVIGSLMNSFH